MQSKNKDIFLTISLSINILLLITAFIIIFKTKTDIINYIHDNIKPTEAEISNNEDNKIITNKTNINEKQESKPTNIENDLPIKQNADDTIEQDSKDKFKYTYDVEGTEYAPDPDNYAGFITCTDGQAPCFVYGIKYGYLAKFFIGQKYTVSFNEVGEGGTAAGTSYAIVTSPIEEILVIAK